MCIDQIERKRRQASRQMLEMVRIGIKQPESLKRIYYFICKHQKVLQFIRRVKLHKENIFEWVRIVEANLMPDDISELYGAVQRV